jgi:N-hydroxyarylamine O-acetyltransferase
MLPANALDLDAYLERVGYDGSVEPTLDSLRGLHLAHATAIPFENLDIQIGRPIRLDLESLQAKLVRDRRGGYCFEQNLLFSAMLEAVGFRLTRLAARVRLGRPAEAEPLPRTHMVLSVDVRGEPWLADVGFGGDGLLLPLPLDPGPPMEQLGRTHRLVQEDDRVRVLQLMRNDGWADMYAFTLEPQLPIDYEVANWWTSTHPSSGFVQNVTAQRVSPEGTLTLRNRQLIEAWANGRTTTTEIPDDDELLKVLAERFGLELRPGTRFRCLSAP